MVKEEFGLEDLKEEYAKSKKKYGLPSFEDLNNAFPIEKAAETETETVLREIRRYISDRLYNYLRFIETFLNPTNAPMFIISAVNTLGTGEKEKLLEAYKKLAKVEVSLIKLDIDPTEEKDAEYIKIAYKLWNDIKGELSDVISFIEDNWGNKIKPNNKDYFG